MSYESPKIESLSIPISLEAFNPKNKASYSLMLLVVSNSSLYDIGMTSWVGEMKTIRAQEPSFEQAPSKHIFQKKNSALSPTTGVIFLTDVSSI